MTTACLNCGDAYEGKFCPACGQHTHTGRITFAGILHEIPHSVFHLDKGLIYTFNQLLTRPGKAISEFIAGKRVNHFKPFAYLFVLSAAGSLVSHWKLLYFEHFMGMHLTINPEIPFIASAYFFRNYPALIFCLLIPFISLWTFMFNRENKYNYWENLVLNTYLIAQFNVLCILNYIYWIVIGQPSGSLTPILSIFFIYLFVAYTQFFKAKPSFTGTLKRIVLFVMVVFTVITGLSLTGFMTPWWGR